MTDIPHPLLQSRGDRYRTETRTVPLLARLLPSASFYAMAFDIVHRGGSLAKKGRYPNEAWAASSFEIFRALERVGGVFEIAGLDHITGLDGPCVFIGNHMSTLETFVLPSIIQPLKDVTFVVKESLLTYPVFGPIMRSRNPIVVGRTNARDDLKAVMGGGCDRLAKGRSLVIFPQTTRTWVFDPKEFNTIGVKLAKRANVPVIPIALKTDLWGNGRLLKDYGKIDIAKTVHFEFGAPLHIKDRGTEEQEAIVEFITTRLKEWGGQLAAP